MHGSEAGNFRYVLSAGIDLTLLCDVDFFAEASAGPAFASWLGTMLAKRGATGGPGGKWFNVSCLGCLGRVTCP